MKLIVNSLRAVAMLLLCTTLASYSTTGNADAPKELRVDMDKCITVDIDTTRLLHLEPTEKSHIETILFLLRSEERFVACDYKKVCTFDRHTGAYLGDPARYGQGDSCFYDISNIWNSSDTIFIFDTARRTLGKYLVDGTVIEKTHPFSHMTFRAIQPPRLIFPMRDGSILTINASAGGSSPENPLVSRYNPDYTYDGDFNGRDVKENWYLADGTYNDTAHNRLLIWEPLRDTIFSAEKNIVAPLYVVNTGKYAFPVEAQNIKELPDRQEAFSGKNNDARYVSMIHYLQTDGKDLYFSLSDNRGHNYIVRYDVGDDACTVHAYASADGRYTPMEVFLLDNDSIHLVMRDNHDKKANSAIYTIHKHELQ